MDFHSKLEHAHDPAPTPLAERLWIWNGDWHKSSFKRRMTLIRLDGDGLFVHNPIALTPNGYAQLEALGQVQYIVSPNRFHASDAGVFKKRFPSARLFVPESIRHGIRPSVPVDGTLKSQSSSQVDSWEGEIESRYFEGLRLLDETLFFHPATRTLLTTDLVFNMRNTPGGVEGMFYRWNRIYQRFGPSRVFRHVFVKDVETVRRSVQEMLKWDIDRVIMNHGEVLETGGREALRKGFQEIGLA